MIFLLHLKLTATGKHFGFFLFPFIGGNTRQNTPKYSSHSLSIVDTFFANIETKDK